MKKSIAILIVALLVLPALSLATPVRAATGHPVLAAIEMNTGNIWFANFTVDIKAGNSIVSKVDSLMPVNYSFAIVFNINGTDLLTWSGGEFDLVFGLTGKAQYNASEDHIYATGFRVSDLNSLTPVERNVTNALLKGNSGTFYLGTFDVVDQNTGLPATVKAIIGPVIFDITNDHTWIKILDGDQTLVAVASQNVNILPAFALSPTSGPGGAEVCLTGVALSASTLYNITYSNSTSAAAQVTTGTDGKFSFCWNIKDLCVNGTSTIISIDIIKNSSGAFIDELNYTEYHRILLNAEVPDDSIGPVYNNSYYGYPGSLLDVFVLDEMTIEGNYFNPTQPVVVTVGGIVIGTVTPNATGYFEVTVNIPVLPIGLKNVTLTNAGCPFIYTIDVYPTLIVTPKSGPIGTNVTFTAYGFPPGEAFLYWEVNHACDYDYCFLWVANATVGDDGQFNVTVTWTVPKMPGGPHYIVALNEFFWENETCSGDFDDGYIGDGYNRIAYTYFTVTPTLWVTPSSFNSDGTTFWVNGTGFDPLIAYTINIDNQAYTVPSAGYFTNDYWAWQEYDTLYPFPIMQWVYNPGASFVVSDLCGDISIQLVKAGFAPGLHSVALTASAYNDYWMYFDFYETAGYYPWEHIGWGTPANGFEEGVMWNLGFYPTDVYTTFTVTAVGDPTVDTILANMTTQLTSLNAKIVSIQGDVATLKTDVGQLQVSVAALDAKVVALQGSVATVQTTLGTMTGTLNTISGNLATVQTDVGVIKADVTAMKPFLPVDMMPVWIAVIFAIIAAIASIYGVLVIRSKIAQ